MSYAPGATETAQTTFRFAGGALILDAATGKTRGRNGVGSARTTAVGLGWSNGAARISSGVVEERGQVLGARSGGALRLGDGSTTAFLEAGYQADAGGWTFDGYGSIGVTHLDTGARSVLSDASDFITSRFGLEASRRAFGGTVSFGLAQPLIVERGTAAIGLARSYDLETHNLRFDSRRIDLSGERRALLSTAYLADIEGGSLRFGLAHGVGSGDTAAVVSIGRRF